MKQLWLLAALGAIIISGCSGGSSATAKNGTDSNAPVAANTTASANPSDSSTNAAGSGTGTSAPATTGTTAGQGATGTTAPTAASTPAPPPSKPVQATAGTYAFNFNPVIGKTYHLTIDSSTTMTGKNAPKAPIKTVQSLTFTALSKTGDQYNVETGIENIDSPQMKAPQAAQMLDQIKKMKIEQTVASNGTVSKTELKNAPAGMPTPTASGQPAAIISLPGHPVKIGDTWESSLTAGGSGGKVKVKLLKVANEGGRQVATLSLTPEASKVKMGFSNLKVDLATGLPISLTVTTEMDIPNQGSVKSVAAMSFK